MALGEKSLYRSSLRGNKCFSLIARIFEVEKETNVHFWEMRADTWDKLYQKLVIKTSFRS